MLHSFPLCLFHVSSHAYTLSCSYVATAILISPFSVKKMEEEPVAVTEPQSTDDLKQLAGKEKKAAKKKLYSQQHPEPQATQRKLLKVDFSCQFL